MKFMKFSCLPNDTNHYQPMRTLVLPHDVMCLFITEDNRRLVDRRSKDLMKRKMTPVKV